MEKRTERLKRRKSNFTMVELLLVLVILATLAAIVVPKFTGRSEQARKTAAQAEISGVELALDTFEVDHGFYPSTQQGLKALVEEPDDVKNWHPYLKKAVERDPWGNAYLYVCPGKHNEDTYDLSSSGPDGREGTDDDITNWDED
jgi:general secretion pathway protein G